MKVYVLFTMDTVEGVYKTEELAKQYKEKLNATHAERSEFAYYEEHEVVEN